MTKKFQTQCFCVKKCYGDKNVFGKQFEEPNILLGIYFVISLVIYMDQFFTSVSLSLNDRGFLEHMLFWYLDRTFKNQEIWIPLQSMSYNWCLSYMKFEDYD